MELKELGGPLIGTLTLVLVGAVALVIYRMELAMIYTLALILVAGVAALLVCIGIALIVRANRSSNTAERERVIERHTHTIDRDGRVPANPKVHLLDNRSRGAELYPYLVKAAFRGGQLQGDEDVIDVEPVETSTKGEW